MPQSLCHGMSEMPSVTPIGLNSASILLLARLRMAPSGSAALPFVRTLRPNSWPARDRREIEEARIFGERPGTLGLAVEALHAYEAGTTVGGTRPPRPAVAFAVGRYRAIHVGRDRVHLGRCEQALDVQVTGGDEEVVHLVGIVVGTKRAREVERASVAITQLDGTGRVDRRAVEGGADHEPPVEEVADVPDALGRARPMPTGS